jgi:hypothetical protein
MLTIVGSCADCRGGSVTTDEGCNRVLVMNMAAEVNV